MSEIFHLAVKIENQLCGYFINILFKEQLTVDFPPQGVKSVIKHCVNKKLC